MKRALSLVMAGALVMGMVSPVADAAAKMKLSKKKVTLEVGKKTVLTVKNAKKKAKWSVTSGKKVVSLSKKKKASVTIKAKKAGKAVVQAKIGKKKLTCKVTVKSADKASVVTAAPTTTPVATTTAAPATNEPQSSAPAATANPTQTPQVTPSVEPSVEPFTEPSAEPSAEPSVSPSEAPVLEPVTDITIDLTDLETSFTGSPAKIGFAGQMESRFDLSLFDAVKITYTTEWASDDAKANFNCCKFGVAKTAETLNGYDDGAAKVFDSQVDGGVATVDLSGAKGTVAGINIQPMDSSYAWPEGLSKVTVTNIVFCAAEGAMYPDPNAPVEPTPVPEPTYAPEEFVYEGLDTSWIDPEKPMVAFTFDDGPIGTKDTDTSMIIQNALHEAGAHATFFYIGEKIKDDGRAEIERAVEYGFEVGNHSFNWSSVSGYEKDELDESIGDTNALLTEITGYSNFLFRAPNLSYSDTMTGYIKAPFIDCAVDSKDWMSSTKTEDIIANVEKAKDGDIILMHATKATTAEAVPTLLAYFQEKGYQVVSVSELFAVRGEKMMTGQIYYSCPPK